MERKEKKRGKRQGEEKTKTKEIDQANISTGGQVSGERPSASAEICLGRVSASIQLSASGEFELPGPLPNPRRRWREHLPATIGKIHDLVGREAALMTGQAPQRAGVGWVLGWSRPGAFCPSHGCWLVNGMWSGADRVWLYWRRAFGEGKGLAGDGVRSCWL